MEQQEIDETIYDCIIIGGGISGISFAHYLNSMGKNILILEKENSLGGQIQSLFSDRYPHYWREFGAHTCYNSYTNLLSIVQDIDAVDMIEPLGKAKYMTYSGGRVKKMFAEISILSLLLNGPKIFFISKNGKTVKEYFSRIVGKKNYSHLFTRLFRAVICQNADNYPAELFLKRRNGRFKEFPRKYTFRNGISSFLESIIKKNELKIDTLCEVISISKDGNTYYLTVNNGKVYKAANIAFSSNPTTSSRLLNKIENPLSELLSSIPVFKSESLNVLIPKDKIVIPNVAGIIPVYDTFLSAVSRDLIADNKIRSFTFHFEEGKQSEEEKYKIICQVLNIQREDILESKLIRHVLPSLQISHLNMADQIRKICTNDSIYLLGNYFYGLSIEDCVHRSQDEFNRFRTNNI